MLSRFSRVRSVWPHGQQPPKLLCPRDSLGKNAGVGAISFSTMGCYLAMKRMNNAIFSNMDGPAAAAAAAAKSLQSCLILCDHIDGSPSGSPVPGILQARALEWAAISLSNAQKWKVKVKLLSRVQLLATPWTETYQAPPSMGFSRQKSTGVGCHCLLCGWT